MIPVLGRVVASSEWIRNFTHIKLEDMHDRPEPVDKNANAREEGLVSSEFNREFSGEFFGELIGTFEGKDVFAGTPIARRLFLDAEDDLSV